MVGIGLETDMLNVQKNSDSLSLFYIKHSAALYSSLLSVAPDNINKDDVEDVMQEVFAGLIVKSDNDLLTPNYFFLKAFPLMLKNARSQGKFSYVLNNELDNMPCFDEEDSNLVSLLKSELVNLPKEHSEIMDMRYNQGMTCKDISTEIDVSVKAVKELIKASELLLKASFSERGYSVKSN